MKKLKLVFALLMTLLLVCVVGTTALAEGQPNAPPGSAYALKEDGVNAIMERRGNIQGPVKTLEAEAMMNETTCDMTAVNRENESIEPTGDGNAGDEDAAAVVLYTWTTLGTVSGLVSITVFITQKIKKYKIVQKIGTQVASYIIALITMECVNIFTGQATLSNIVLCVFNAFLISLAANGLYDTVNKNKTATDGETDFEDV